MKNKILITAVLFFVLLTALTGCTPNPNRLVKKLEDNGYTVAVTPVEEADLTAFKDLLDLNGAYEITEVLYAYKIGFFELDIVAVIYFASIADMKDAYETISARAEGDTESIKDIANYLNLKMKGRAIVVGTENGVALV